MDNQNKQPTTSSLRVPVRIRVISNKHKVLKRTFPEHATIQVKEKEEVFPEKIIANAKTSVGFRSFRLAEMLGLKDPSLVKQYLTCKTGDTIYKGQKLAERKRLFGFKTSVITSPIDGVVRSFHEETGRITLEFLPSFVKIAAGMPGVVEKVEKGKSVFIASTVSQVFGVLGSGRERAGFIKMTVKPGDFLLPSNIDASFAGSILIGGAMITRDTLEKALAMGVSGIVTGGIHLKDYESIGGERTIQIGSSGTDVGVTILVTEGFGRIPMGEDIWTTLFHLNGKYALIDGESKAVTIPMGEKGKEEIEIPSEKELAVGDTVRIIADPDIGIIGQVTAVGSKKERLDSGLEAVMIELQVGKETKKIPAQNLEIIIR